jgi:hypothetical protein
MLRRAKMKTDKFEIFFYILIVVLLFLLVVSARGQENQTGEIQSSGGAFSITKTVVAGGGRAMQNAPASVSATVGQTAAGKTSTGGQFKLYSGFWTPDDFTPTAAEVTVGGRVSTADGNGIRNIVITIVFPTGETRAARSASFGYYNFTGIPVGGTYIISVSGKRYTFTQASVVRAIEGDTQDVNFIADAQNSIKTAEEIQ